MCSKAGNSDDTGDGDSQRCQIVFIQSSLSCYRSFRLAQGGEAVEVTVHTNRIIQNTGGRDGFIPCLKRYGCRKFPIGTFTVNGRNNRPDLYVGLVFCVEVVFRSLCCCFWRDIFDSKGPRSHSSCRFHRSRTFVEKGQDTVA